MDAATPATERTARGGGATRGGPALPEPVARASTAAVVAFVGGAAAVGVACLTKPVPDPSFPWATPPASGRGSPSGRPRGSPRSPSP
jgi:hypothetical protein